MFWVYSHGCSDRELYLDWIKKKKKTTILGKRLFLGITNIVFLWQLVHQFLLLCHTQKGLRQTVWKVNRKKTGTKMCHANLAALQWDPKERWLQVHLWVQKERNQPRFPVWVCARLVCCVYFSLFKQNLQHNVTIDIMVTE